MKNTKKYHISKTAPKSNRKIIETEAQSITKAHFPIVAHALHIEVAWVQTSTLNNKMMRLVFVFIPTLRCGVFSLFLHCFVVFFHYSYIVLWCFFIIPTLRCGVFSLFLHCVVVFFHYSYIVLWCFSLFLHCVVVFFFILTLCCGVFVFIPTLCCDVFLYSYIVLWCFSLLTNYTYILFLQCFMAHSFT